MKTVGVQTLGAEGVENGLVGGGERRRLEQLRRELPSHRVGCASNPEQALSGLVPGAHLLVGNRPSLLKVAREETFHRHPVEDRGTTGAAAHVGQKAVASRGVLNRFRHSTAARQTPPAFRIGQLQEAGEIFRQLAAQCISGPQVQTLFQEENPAARGGQREACRGAAGTGPSNDHIPEDTFRFVKTLVRWHDAGMSSGLLRVTWDLMLFLANLDVAPRPLVEELLDSGRLPALRALMKQGTVLPTVTAPLVGVEYPSLYGGKRPADHGIYFPFQWSAEAQRVRSWYRIGLADTVFRRVDEAGRRMVVIDPPECFPQTVRHGFIVSGWQFEERALLAPWGTKGKDWTELRRRFGSGERTQESFGRPTAKGLLAIARVLAEGPGRLQRAAEFFLNGHLPEALWINFAGMHLASHQFYDLSLLEDGTISKEDRRRLELVSTDLLTEHDRVLGRMLELLPAGSDTLFFLSTSIGPITGWVDLLPEMLRRTLGAPAVSSPVSAVREWAPRAWREQVATALPESMGRDLTAFLWSPRADWSRTRAFTLPSDAPGFIRLNLRGRERLGCVAPGEDAALCAEITAGLSSFTDLDGEPCIRKILRPREVFGEGERLDAFPDLLVLWAPKKTLRGRGVRSPRFGEILRRGDFGTGRSGDHTEGGMVLVAPGAGALQRPGREVQPYDIPATILSALGLPHDDLPGHALLKRPLSAARPSRYS